MTETVTFDYANDRDAIITTNEVRAYPSKKLLS